MDRRNPKLTPSLDPQVRFFCSEILLTRRRFQCTKGRIVAEEELQILNKPSHVSTAEEDENQCGKSGYGQVLHEPFLKLLKHEEGDESEVSRETERLALQSITIPNQVGDHVDEGESSIFAKQGMLVVAIGTMIFADVLGRTLSGRHLVSSRRYFRRIVWHQDGSMIKKNVPQLKSFRDKKELSSNLTNSRYKQDIARSCKDVLKTG
ncbi:hypothetical protein HID58_042443 [Brassica napus]|uniref:Uncharacterized protein n=1 Tax=Brassica napus TaxID=3708 RepID=A0ABQ8BDS5_BRANA|nr:hypothetical protein HID58_042443 [Brassica napus]